MSDACNWYLETYETFFGTKSEYSMIPLAELFAYTDHLDIIGPIDEFIYVMQKLDKRYMKFLKEKHSG